MEFEDAPLDDNELPTRPTDFVPKLEGSRFDLKFSGQRKLNTMRVSLLAIFLSVLTVFAVKMTDACGMWDENDPGYCYQSVMMLSFWTCGAETILLIVWMWAMFVFTLCERVRLLNDFFNIAFRKAVNKVISRQRLDGIIREVKYWIIKFRINRLWNSRLILTIIRVSRSCLPNIYLMFQLIDIKLSNRKLLASEDENQWTFGQIMPMIMLLTIPLAMAKLAWGQPEPIDQRPMFFKDQNESSLFGGSTDSITTPHVAHSTRHFNVSSTNTVYVPRSFHKISTYITDTYSPEGHSETSEQSTIQKGTTVPTSMATAGSSSSEATVPTYPIPLRKRQTWHFADLSTKV
ncbi:hypothetical protein BZA77DRAFT_308762 [Pyronema omphalodes]|nr:hypothetical protein BZA77DRAFT_308762 [Pyronema omphalodes]